MDYTGSIRKECTAWYYVIDLGKGVNGKHTQKEKRGFKTEEEVNSSLIKALHELNTDTYI
ncbi:Arm DNA-binding domain-containing protein [Pseudobacillus sp. 179-B 2D1 NHS]|uniref:Arm DNA-binding domain-containing protein n=1 Tax=Pseudobacillus sp. 179-B 2D1 NHS TaxID=3374292 RepID=UPI00387A33E4